MHSCDWWWVHLCVCVFVCRRSVICMAPCVHCSWAFFWFFFLSILFWVSIHFMLFRTHLLGFQRTRSLLFLFFVFFLSLCNFSFQFCCLFGKFMVVTATCFHFLKKCPKLKRITASIKKKESIGYDRMQENGKDRISRTTNDRIVKWK